jgi:hypothetical protein
MTIDNDECGAKFLRPDSLRLNLILVSLFIAAYETLRESIVQQLKDLYRHGFDEALSKGYESEVLCLSAKRNSFQASVAWLRSKGVIDEADEEIIAELRRHRNEVVHELPKFVAEAGKDVQVLKLTQIQRLVAKIDRWWIINFELDALDIDPANVGPEEISSSRMVFLDLMIGIATGTRYTDLYREVQQAFEKQAQQKHAKKVGTSCS